MSPKRATWIKVTVVINGRVARACEEAWWNIRCGCGAVLRHAFSTVTPYSRHDVDGMLLHEFGLSFSKKGNSTCPCCSSGREIKRGHWVDNNEVDAVNAGVMNNDPRPPEQPFQGACALKVTAWRVVVDGTAQYLHHWVRELVRVFPTKYDFEEDACVWEWPRRTEYSEGCEFMCSPDGRGEIFRWSPSDHEESWVRWKLPTNGVVPDKFFYLPPFVDHSDSGAVRVYEEPYELKYNDFYTEETTRASSSSDWQYGSLPQ